MEVGSAAGQAFGAPEVGRGGRGVADAVQAIVVTRGQWGACIRRRLNNLEHCLFPSMPKCLAAFPEPNPTPDPLLPLAPAALLALTLPPPPAPLRQAYSNVPSRVTARQGNGGSVVWVQGLSKAEGRPACRPKQPATCTAVYAMTKPSALAVAQASELLQPALCLTWLDLHVTDLATC